MENAVPFHVLMDSTVMDVGSNVAVSMVRLAILSAGRVNAILVTMVKTAS